MANRITKKMTVTCVSYGLCELVDGEMTYVEQPDLILKGIRSKDFVRKHLTKKHGADANVSIKNIDAGEHRFSMSLEDFVRAADVDVDEPARKFRMAIPHLKWRSLGRWRRTRRLQMSLLEIRQMARVPAAAKAAMMGKRATFPGEQSPAAS